MSMPHATKPLVPTFDLVINGTPLPPEDHAYVTEITVDVNTSMPGMFSVTLSGADTQQDPSWVDRDTFAVGRVMEIRMGYDDQLACLIKGEITGLEPDFSAHRLPMLTVRGYDRAHRLMRGARTQTFVNMTDSEIARKIAREMNLQFQGPDSQVIHDYVLQSNQTDLEFLHDCARRIHYELIVEDQSLLFRPIANAESEVLTLTMEHDLLEFSPRLTSLQQVSEITVRGWNSKEKREIIGRSRRGDEGSRMGGPQSDTKEAPSAFGDRTKLISERPISTQAEADQLAQSYFKDMALSLISGDAVCWGRTDLVLGRVVKIEGVGKRFGGQYYVTGLTHRYGAQRGFHTHFEFRRNAT